MLSSVVSSCAEYIHDVSMVSDDYIHDIEIDKTVEPKKLYNQSWETVFNHIFEDMEARCHRDWKQVRRFKKFVKMKVWSLKNLTYWEADDCVQTIMQIIIEGCEAFYRTQYEEFFKKRWKVELSSCFDPESKKFLGYKLSHLKQIYKVHKDTGAGFKELCDMYKTPIRPSRAQFSTWMFRHLENKYASQMTKFFGPKRAFESARLRTETFSVKIQDDSAKHWVGACSLLTKKEILVPAIILEKKPEFAKTIGTALLSRSLVDDPESPISLMADDSWQNQPELMRQVRKFRETHNDVIKLVISLPEKPKGEISIPNTISETVRPLASHFNLGVKDFISAIRGIFGHDSNLQTA